MTEAQAGPAMSSEERGTREAVRFVDFAVRAWREGSYVQVLAHATPAGSMRHPVATRVGPFAADDYRLPPEATLAEGAALGRRLSRMLLQEPVWRLLGESLREIAVDPTLGLRLRLCLDDDLIDLPWELLYRLDLRAPASPAGFLLMDGTISLVREPARVATPAAPTNRTQHGLFVGAFFDDGADHWGVRVEHASLTRAIRPVENLLRLDFLKADDTAAVDRRLNAGCDLFHYAGHTEISDGRGRLVQVARTQEPVYLDAFEHAADWADSDELARRLAAAGCRVAVFNACNSGYWPFVRPLIAAGVPAVIGVQGLVSNVASLNFAARLYESLAVGLSLDEALTYARLHLLEPGRSHFECDWARFMAYMPTDSAVLFPRAAEDRTVARQQDEARTQRERVVRGVRFDIEQLDGAGISSVHSEIAARSVLILGRFTDPRKAVLDALRDALRSPRYSYIPVVFDFEKPQDRDLIESILVFAGSSRFVIADLSDPKSVPAELQAIVPIMPSLPVVPIIEAGQREYPVSDHILRRPSVARPVVAYRDIPHLLEILDQDIVATAESLYARLRPPALTSRG